MERRLFVAITAGSILGGASGCLTSSSNTTPEATTDHNEERTTAEANTGHGSNASATLDGQETEPDGHHEDDESHHSEDDESHHHDVEPLESPVPHADVAMVSDEGHHFDPHFVWIRAGGSVTWLNESGSHTTTAYHEDNEKPHRVPENAPGWDSGLLGTDQTYERTFDDEGVYDYFCQPHESGGMVGSIVVGNPDPHAQPALEPPQEELPATAREMFERLHRAVSETLEHTH